MKSEKNPIATFTLAVRDPKSKTLAIITASNYLAVGSLVPWIDCQGGLIVSQSFANPNAAKRALDTLRQGHNPSEALVTFLKNDPDAEKRQVGILDQKGRCELYSGSLCTEVVESVEGENFFVLGNMLKPGTVSAIANTLSECLENESDLGDAMIKAMMAGEEAGGDSRGKLAAALLIKRPSAGYQENSDTLADLRVDAHHKPLYKLRELYSLFKLYNPRLFNDHMVNISDLASDEVRTINEALRSFANTSAIYSLDNLIDVRNLLRTHNLAENIDVENKKINKTFLEESDQLLHFLKSSD